MNETRITELRRARGWTQENLAERSGVAVRTVQRIEAGSDASMATLSLIADALGVAVSELYVRVETQHFETAVADLEERRKQQRARDGVVHFMKRAYGGLGLIVTFGIAALTLTHVWNAWAWLAIPIYWAGGQAILTATLRYLVSPRLDAKYPLSTPSAAEPDLDKTGDR